MTKVDGRTARREGNRLAVLDAVIELFAEDVMQPRPEDVAARSGVSLRSVYRYYSDPAELVRAAMERHLERVVPLLHLDAIGEGPLDDRLARFLAARLRLHDAIAPVARAARVAAMRNDVIRARYELTRRTLRDQLETHFEPELAALPAPSRLAVAAAMDALTQLEALDCYRVERACSIDETSVLLGAALARLLAT